MPRKGHRDKASLTASRCPVNVFVHAIHKCSQKLPFWSYLVALGVISVGRIFFYTGPRGGDLSFILSYLNLYAVHTVAANKKLTFCFVL